MLFNDKFWDQVDVRGYDDCWEWKGATTSNGYGAYHRTRAHRRAYELHVGPIPSMGSKIHVCHSCDNRLCCNPGHLWVGTARANKRDCINKGRHVLPVWHCGEKNKAAKLTQKQADEIWARLQKGEATLDLAYEFSISRSTIYRIKYGVNWRRVG